MTELLKGAGVVSWTCRVAPLAAAAAVVMQSAIQSFASSVSNTTESGRLTLPTSAAVSDMGRLSIECLGGARLAAYTELDFQTAVVRAHMRWCGLLPCCVATG